VVQTLPAATGRMYGSTQAHASESCPLQHEGTVSSLWQSGCQAFLLVAATTKQKADHLAAMLCVLHHLIARTGVVCHPPLSPSRETVCVCNMMCAPVCPGHVGYVLYAHPVATGGSRSRPWQSAVWLHDPTSLVAVVCDTVM
jgi:hypothetical protein